MAYALIVDVIDPSDGTIKVTHTFWGLTEAEARTYFQEHVQSCEYFAAAVKEARVIEELEEIPEDELPDPEDLEEDDEEEEEGT